MAISYGIEKFGKAVDSLATSASNWRDRLYDGFRCVYPIVPEEDLPEDLAPRFVALRQAITRIGAKHGEGTIKATINQMSEEEGERLMAEIYSIYEDVRHCEEE
jgi:hypothetical protein